MRLNKLISDSGLCSRREADELIAAGRVTVDGARAAVGQELAGGELVCVDGTEVRARSGSGSRRTVYIALNKPVGITCTTEREVGGNIVDFVDHAERIFPIGRLDKDSEGLILLTNDGDIVNPILRAENRHEKEYVVEVNKPVTAEFLTGMARGVHIGHGEVTLPCRLAKLGRYGFRIVLTQGLNRQIRRMAQAFGYRVRLLCRVRIMHIRLGHLKPGQWRNLSAAEVAGLMQHCNEAAKSPRQRAAKPTAPARTRPLTPRAATSLVPRHSAEARPAADARRAARSERPRPAARRSALDRQLPIARAGRDEAESTLTGAGRPRGTAARSLTADAPAPRRGERPSGPDAAPRPRRGARNAPYAAPPRPRGRRPR